MKFGIPTGDIDSLGDQLLAFVKSAQTATEGQK